MDTRNISKNQDNKVDVVINVYGKLYQTLCTLKSLMLHSGKHIDKIFLIEEKEQPHNSSFDVVLQEFDNLIRYVPNKYFFLLKMRFLDILFMRFKKKEFRYNFRYQYGIEKSDKKHVFITHNDILYTGDIIGNMLSEISSNVGIGAIGQCWNCPANKADLCDGARIENYHPTYNEIVELCKTYPPARGKFIKFTNKKQPMPLPECRLNEFACLIDRDIYIKESLPKGSARLFGDYKILDMGDAWFRDMVLKGYKFKNYDIDKDSKHMFFANNEAGNTVRNNSDMYKSSEEFAKRYYEQNYLK